MTIFFLSREADEDLQDIYAYGEETWGETQAARYLRELYSVFDLVADNPMIGRARSRLSEGLRSFVHGSHVVFYMPWQGEVAIVRVLHGTQDVEAVFEDYDPDDRLSR